MERRPDKKSCCNERDESEVAEEEEREEVMNLIGGEERKNYAWKEGRERGQEAVANEFGDSSSGL